MTVGLSPAGVKAIYYSVNLFRFMAMTPFCSKCPPSIGQVFCAEVRLNLEIMASHELYPHRIELLIKKMLIANFVRSVLCIA